MGSFLTSNSPLRSKNVFFGCIVYAAICADTTALVFSRADIVAFNGLILTLAKKTLGKHACCTEIVDGSPVNKYLPRIEIRRKI